MNGYPYKKIVQLILFAGVFPLILSGGNLKDSYLPIIHINTLGQKIVDEPKITASMLIYWMPEGRIKPLDTHIHYDGYIGIELRGNSSQSWPKKPYKIETRDENGGTLNFSLIGLPKENDWVLHAPYVDKTLMRNALMYRILSEMGWYAPHYRFCELYINNDYKGVYLLVESLKIDENRIDITRTNTNELTGGYFLELTTSNRLQETEPYIKTAIAEQTMAIKYPNEDELTEAHKQYITTYLNAFEKALHEKKFSGDDDYKNYIDVSSFIDHMLVAEVFRQLDAFCASHHFYKDANAKLAMGPGWDFNRSIGNYKGWDTWKTEGFWLTSYRGGFKPFWPEYIYQDESFMKLYKQRYSELRESILNTPHITAIIDEYSKYLDEAKDRNFEVWDITENRSHKYVQGSYEGELDYIKNWIKKRFNWLDKEWGIKPHPVINEFYANAEGSGSQWVELFNPYDSTVNISGWKLAVNEESFTFPTNTLLGAHSYLILTDDIDKFLAKHPDISNVYMGLKGELLNDNITLQLSNNSEILDELKTSVSNGWPPISKSGNYSLGMRPIAHNNSDGRFWNWSASENGSPGKINEIYDYKGLLISEIMSLNNNTISDEYLEYNDWIELSNTSNYTVNLNGLFLSDRLDNCGKWQLMDPFNKNNTILEPGKSIILWLDSDAELQGNLHASFSLSSLGERVILSYNDGYNFKLVDQVLTPVLGADQSYQLINDTSDVWQISDYPTPGELYSSSTQNKKTLAKDLNIKVYPNPVKTSFTLDFNMPATNIVSISLVDYCGRNIMNVINKRRLISGHYSYSVSLSKDLSAGIYFLHLKGDGFAESKKLMILNP